MGVIPYFFREKDSNVACNLPVLFPHTANVVKLLSYNSEVFRNRGHVLVLSGNLWKLSQRNPRGNNWIRFHLIVRDTQNI